MAATLYGYQTIQLTYGKNQLITERLDNLQTLLQFFMHDIQGCGYRGCRTLDSSAPFHLIYKQNNPEYRFFRFDRPLFAFKAQSGSCFGSMPESACLRAKENSTVLILYNVPKKLYSLARPMKTPFDDLYLKGSPDLWNNSLVLISDCEKADVFIASLVTNNIVQHEKMIKMNEINYLSKAYDISAEVGELQTIAYYIGEINRDIQYKSKNPTNQNNPNNPNNPNIPSSSKNANHSNKSNKEQRYALFRDDFIHSADELIPDINDIDIELGIVRSNTAGIHYLPIESMEDKDWQLVSTVRIQLISELHGTLNYEIALRNRNGFNLGCHSLRNNIAMGFSSGSSESNNSNTQLTTSKAACSIHEI